MRELAVAAVHRPPLLGDSEDLSDFGGPQRMQGHTPWRAVLNGARVAQPAPPAVRPVIRHAQQRARPPVHRAGAHRAVDQLQDLLLGLRGHPSGQRTAQPQPTFPRSTASSMAWALTASVN